MENTYKEPKRKYKIVKRFKSTLDITMYNTHMEYLVELPSGQRVWLSDKEVRQIKNN